MDVQGLVSIAPWTVIAQILNLFIQLFLIKKFLFKPINEMLKKRKELADQEISDAKASREEADSLKEQYESSLTNAKKEASDIIAEAHKTAEQKADALVKQAEADAQSIRSKAEADIAQEKKKAINEAKDEIGGIAMDIAGKVVDKEINEADHKKLIDEFINHVGEAS